MKVVRADTENSTEDARPEKIGGFDALRVFAALAVVLLHAGVPYLRHPMPGLLWPVTDASHRVVDALFWGIEVMIMPLFLVIAGFLMWRSSLKATPGRLVRSRAKRLLIPLGFAIMVILPMDLYVWTMGLVSDGRVPVAKLRSLRFDSPISDQIWGLSHLWFILYVFLYIAVAAIGLRFVQRKQSASRVRHLWRGDAVWFVLIAIATATLTLAPEVVWGFQHAFLPVPSKWIYSGVFFAGGCVLAVKDVRMEKVCRQTPRLLMFGGALLISAVTLGIWALEQSQAGNSPDTATSLLLAALTATAAGTITLGLIGSSVRMVNSDLPGIKYLAAASFWVYLVHHPLVGLVHIDLKVLWPQGAPLVKLAVSFFVTTGLSILTYEVFVRRTALGALLGFSYAPKTSSVETIVGDEMPAILSMPGNEAIDEADTGPRRRRAA